jgi:aminopeptidase N
MDGKGFSVAGHSPFALAGGLCFSRAPMNATFRLLFALGLSGAVQLGAHDLACGWSAPRTSAPPRVGPESPDYRKYARDREVDILHLALDVTPDFKARTVAGTATWKFRPIAKPFAELRLDAVNLNVEGVVSSEKIAGYQANDDELVVTFSEPVPAGREASVTVRYRAEPKKGLYFRTPELGFKPEDLHIWTQGEPEEARHWYPSYDYPNEKFTCEVTCHVPEGLVALSNGRKVSEQKDAQGLVAVRWMQDKPMVNYLVALVAGRLKFIEDRHRDIPMRFWTPASEIAFASNSFFHTKPAMEFFEKEIGVPYPWDKYDQVCIQDYHWGGMENTTLTTLTINTLFPNGYENLRSSQGLVAHELAHQWFGDLLTCKDWSHLWLNEGFATFYDKLYTEHRDGRDEYLYRVWEGLKTLTAGANTNKSIVWRKYNTPEEQFDGFAYGKGSFVLHMLREQLGTELFRRCVNTFVERHKFGSVVTEDFRAVVEDLSGRSYDQFFEQWVYHTGFPHLDIDWSWDEKAKLAKVSVRQSQPVTETAPLFNVPLPVRFKTRSGVVERTFPVRDRVQEFSVPLPEQPQVVRIDPAASVLARINFRPATAMLRAMLADPSDVIGRFIACEQLAERRDGESVARLKEALNKDGYWAVRAAASKALRSMHHDEAFAALRASMKQPDARARRQVVTDVVSFYRPEAFDAALTVVRTEKNPDIVAAALRALDSASTTNVRAALIEFLHSKSWREHLAETSLGVIRARRDPLFIELLHAAITQRANEFPRPVLGTALDTIASLARDEADKGLVRELVAGFLDDRREAVRVAAINALGTLRDERALPLLDRFALAQKAVPERAAAERAIESIRSGKKPVNEMSDMRQAVLDLQKQTRELRRELEALRAKSGSATPRPTR